MNSDQWEDNNEIHGGNHSVLAEEEEWQFKILLLSEEDEEIKKLKKKNDLADEKLDFALSYDINEQIFGCIYTLHHYSDILSKDNSETGQ